MQSIEMYDTDDTEPNSDSSSSDDDDQDDDHYKTQSLALQSFAKPCVAVSRTSANNAPVLTTQSLPKFVKDSKSTDSVIQQQLQFEVATFGSVFTTTERILFYTMIQRIFSSWIVDNVSEFRRRSSNKRNCGRGDEDDKDGDAGTVRIKGISDTLIIMTIRLQNVMMACLDIRADRAECLAKRVRSAALEFLLTKHAIVVLDNRDTVTVDDVMKHVKPKSSKRRVQTFKTGADFKTERAREKYNERQNAAEKNYQLRQNDKYRSLAADVYTPKKRQLERTSFTTSLLGIDLGFELPGSANDDATLTFGFEFPIHEDIERLIASAHAKKIKLDLIQNIATGEYCLTNNEYQDSLMTGASHQIVTIQFDIFMKRIECESHNYVTLNIVHC